MKNLREDDVCLALSLSVLSSGDPERKKVRRSPAGDGGEFVCKTCSRAFASFQALGGHMTSHLRGRHGLALGLPAGGQEVHGKPGKKEKASHDCHVCGQAFEIGQALGGHMRRHQKETAAPPAPAAPQRPVLLELFV